MSSVYHSLEELNPNCAVIFKKAGNNKDDLASLLENPPNEQQGISLAFEDGSKPDTAYCFLRVVDQESRCYIENVIAKLDFVESVIPLYDQRRQKLLASYFEKSTKLNKLLTFPSDVELTNLAKLTNNAEVSLYLSFLKYYNHFLSYLSIFGVTVNFFTGSEAWQFNKLYSVVCICWSFAFVTSWLFYKEPTCAANFARFQTQQLRRTEEDTSSEMAVLLKKLGFTPVAISFSVLLLLWQLLCFFVEIFFTQIYDGPLKLILSLIPTIMFSGFNAGLTFVYNKFFVDPYVEYEGSMNPTKSKFEKNFVLKAVGGYAPLLITLFLYYPFGYLFTPEKRREALAWCRLPLISGDFIVNVKRHQNQFFYFIVTNQVVLLALDNVVPLILERVTDIFLTSENVKENSLKVEQAIKASDNPQNFAVWKTVREYENEPIMIPFDVDSNYQNLLLEFGYLTMFSAIWPLAPFITYLINFIILKVNLWRITKKSRPTYIPGVTSKSVVMPALTMSTAGNKALVVSSLVEPWDDILKIVAFLGSIIMPSITYMYQYCYIPGIGISTFITATVRSTWYKASPLVHSWGSILLVGVVCEHFSFLLYHLLKKHYVDRADIVSVDRGITLESNTFISPVVHDDAIESIDEKVGDSNYMAISETTTSDTDLVNRRNKHVNPKRMEQTDVAKGISSTSAFSQAPAHILTSVPALNSVDEAKEVQPSNDTNNEKSIEDEPAKDGGNPGEIDYGVSNTDSNPASDSESIDDGEDDQPIQEEEVTEENKISQLSGRELKKKMDLRKISSIDLIPPTTDANLLGNAPSDIAGATLPATIPTSMNYSARLGGNDAREEEANMNTRKDTTEPTAVLPQTEQAVAHVTEPVVVNVSPSDSPFKTLNVPKQRSGSGSRSSDTNGQENRVITQTKFEEGTVPMTTTTKAPVKEVRHDVGAANDNVEDEETHDDNEGTRVSETTKDDDDDDARSDSVASSTASAPATPTSPKFTQRQELPIPDPQLTENEHYEQLQEPEALHFREHPHPHSHHHHHGRFTSKSKLKVHSMLSTVRSNEEDKTLKKTRKKSLLSKLKGKI